MSALVDLHMHTTASDGTLQPAELVRVLAATTLRLVAITDHDSLEGIAEAKREVANHPQLTLIPGIEVSSDDGDSEVHVLGYHMDETDPELHDILVAFHRNREGRGEIMVEKLREMGFLKDEEEEEPTDALAEPQDEPIEEEDDESRVEAATVEGI